jgi:hypothetical protein
MIVHALQAITMGNYKHDNINYKHNSAGNDESGNKFTKVRNNIPSSNVPVAYELDDVSQKKGNLTPVAVKIYALRTNFTMKVTIH